MCITTHLIDLCDFKRLEITEISWNQIDFEISYMFQLYSVGSFGPCKSAGVFCGRSCTYGSIAKAIFNINYVQHGS